MRAFDPQLLPAGWQVATLEEILNPTETVDPKKQFEEYFDYIDIEAVDNSNQCISSPKRLAASAAPSRARRKVQRGDIVFSLVRPYLKNIAIVGEGLDGAIASTAFFVCRPNSVIEGRFLFNYLRQDSFIKEITTYGDSPPAAHDDEFVRLQIPIAPPKEQERIADALDELLTDLDAGMEALRRAQAKLALYRASLLKAAVQGDLTAEWREQHPNAETASALLQRILAERRQRWEQEQIRKFKAVGKTPPANWKTKYKEPVAPDVSGLPQLPHGWCWTALDQLLRESLRNGHSSKSTLTGEGVPTFSLSAVTYGDFSSSNIKMTAADPSKVGDLWVQPDDILIERSNTPELVGTARRYTGVANAAIFPDLLIRVRSTPSVLPAFIEAVLQSPTHREYFRKRAQGISGSMPKIDQEVIERASIPLCSREEQSVLMEIVEDQLSIIEHLEADLAIKLTNAKALRQSIFRHAFRGKLVPQNPTDQPASELLKRLTTERQERSKTKATPRKRVTRRKSKREN